MHTLAFNMADNPCILVKRFDSDLSCCGIVLDSENGIVLTVASLFTDLLPKIETQPSFSKHWRVLFQDDFGTPRTSRKGEIAVEVVLRRYNQEKFQTLQGFLVLFWRDVGLQKIAERIFPSSEWKFESLNPVSSELKQPHLTEGNAQQKQNEVFAHQSALCDFVLIYVKDLEKHLSCEPLVIRPNYARPKRGDPVFVVGTPFGCECPVVFYNSVSKGIVSNLAGANNEVIITDARCIPGSEGCTMYLSSSQSSSSVENSKRPYGIILAPFCWRNGEWIGITVACSLDYLLDNLGKRLATKFAVIPKKLAGLSRDFIPQENMCCDVAEMEKKDMISSTLRSSAGSLNTRDFIHAALDGVVRVQCGSTWGSGIVLDADEGLIATCSHVISGYQSHNRADNNNNTQHSSSTTPSLVSCMSSSGIYHNAQILYATKEGFPLDFAVLRIQPSTLLRSFKSRTMAGIPQSSSIPLYKKGEGVYVIGFPLFASNQNAKPSIVSGVISNIAYANSHPVLLQSSAAVHCGASGGALVSMVTGELLGMVTSNTKDVNMASAFPHVNFSIPADLLHKLVVAIKNGRSVGEDLKTLVSDSAASIWKLNSIEHENPNIISKL